MHLPHPSGVMVGCRVGKHANFSNSNPMIQAPADALTCKYLLAKESFSTYTATLVNGEYQCPRSPNSGDAKYWNIKPYPSGYFEAVDPRYMAKPSGQLWISKLPAGLNDWIRSHKPPNTTFPNFWTDISNCTMGYGEGIPVAHIPVTELTASALTTMTMTGYYGNPAMVAPTASPGPSAPLQDTVPTSSSHVSPGESRAGTPAGTTAGKIPPEFTPMPGVGNPPDDKTAGAAQGKVTGVGSGSGSNPQSYLGSSVVINGVTLAPGTTQFIIIGGSTYLANSVSGFVVDGQSLTRGGVITEAGETISLAIDGSSVIVAQGTTTMTEGLGTIIASQGGFTASKPSGYVGPLASSARRELCFDARAVGAILGILLMNVWGH